MKTETKHPGFNGFYLKRKKKCKLKENFVY